MIGGPLDVGRIPQAVRQDRRRPREENTRIRRPASSNDSGLREDRVAFIKIELIDGLCLDELVTTVQVFHTECCRGECVSLTTEAQRRRLRGAAIGTVTARRRSGSAS